LQAEIVEKGAVISEYLPKMKARPEHFPRRNLLIGSWSEKILVVEAAQKSGALITAQYAKMQGHEVLVPPHELYRSNVAVLLSEGKKRTNVFRAKIVGSGTIISNNALVLDRSFHVSRP
jgi:predicted Rossmann fold nucleotide-binding protein DprA/Smf involved in DNA uptake